MEQEKPITNAIIRIKVVGVGGGGNSVLLRLAKDQMPGVELIAVNTDAKQLSLLQATGVQTIQIGKNLTKGRGTGGAAELGEQAAAMEESALEKSFWFAKLSVKALRPTSAESSLFKSFCDNFSSFEKFFSPLRILSSSKSIMT